MKGFHYFMPADVYFGKDCILKKNEIFKKYGQKALLVTGRSSAKKNGAQKDVVEALEAVGISWVLFDEIGENPDLETVERAGLVAVQENVDFIIGIGGGSPMDASKAIAVLAANPGAPTEILFAEEKSAYLPVIAVPTTAGTGSEVTQFAVMTLHKKRTKAPMAARVFAEAAFLDSKYMETLSPKVTNNTAIDALTHLIESYLSAASNFMSEQIVEAGLKLFKDCIPALKAREYDEETRDKLLLASTFAGIAIAQTGTSLPHYLGYYLTYEKGIPHGRANGMLMKEYLALFPQGDAKVAAVLQCLSMDNIDDLDKFMEEVLDITETFTADELKDFAKRAMEAPQRLLSFSAYSILEEHVYTLYERSLLK